MKTVLHWLTRETVFSLPPDRIRQMLDGFIYGACPPLAHGQMYRLEEVES